jgi:8-oxo-dGTP diphosphatase
MNKVTRVAVAILQNESGEFLLASRPEGKPWAGWWEFPGGKIELSETPEAALVRELQEELGVTPTLIQPWLKRVYDYPKTHDSSAKTVHLYFFFVQDWHGEIHPCEGQQLSWQSPHNISVSPVLPANTSILKALALPSIYAISNASELGEQVFLSALEMQLKNGLSLLQFREHHKDQNSLAFAEKVIKVSHQYKAKVLINNGIEIARKLGADGVHMPSAALLKLKQKPENLIVAASCHNAEELAHAQKLALDFVVLSPVKPTKSHQGAVTLGWEKFATLIEAIEIPVYALGGMNKDDLPKALAHGARGVAMQRAVWR